MTKVGIFELQVIAALSRLGGKAYASEIYDEILASGRKRTMLSKLYNVLARLQTKKLVAARTMPSRPISGGRSRQRYRLTAAGVRVLARVGTQVSTLRKGEA